MALRPLASALVTRGGQGLIVVSWYAPTARPGRTRQAGRIRLTLMQSARIEDTAIEPRASVGATRGSRARNVGGGAAPTTATTTVGARVCRTSPPSRIPERGQCTATRRSGTRPCCMAATATRGTRGHRAAFVRVPWETTR